MGLFIKRKTRSIVSDMNKRKTLAQRRKDIMKQADKQTRNIQKPSKNELDTMHQMLKQIDEYNKLTFEYAEQLESLEDNKKKLSSSEYTAQKSNVIRRNERANRNAHDLKKTLSSMIRQYNEFTVTLPKNIYGGKEHVTYYYNVVDGRIKKIERKLEELLSHGEQSMIEYRKTGAVLPRYLK